MTKIIDIKTREIVHAPSDNVKTPKLCKGFHITEGEFAGRLGIIAKDDATALVIYAQVTATIAKEKAA